MYGIIQRKVVVSLCIYLLKERIPSDVRFFCLLFNLRSMSAGTKVVVIGRFISLLFSNVWTLGIHGFPVLFSRVLLKEKKCRKQHHVLLHNFLS